jgi:hypothetical protein
VKTQNAMAQIVASAEADIQKSIVSEAVKPEPKPEAKKSD